MTGPRPLFVAALTAAEHGWPVFPLRPCSKLPALRGWPHEATCDPDQLALWWAAAPYNVAIACGPARLLVVDIDRPTSTGDVPLAGLDLPDTHTVSTPSGQHRYYTVTADRPGRCTAGLLAARVDTRAAGGYVVAAGSVRRVGDRLRRYRVTSPAGVDPAPAPHRLLAALDRPRPTAHRFAGLPGASVPGSSYVRAAVAGETTRVREAPTGTRNSALFTAAVHLGELAAAGLIEESDIYRWLEHACAPHIGVDGFTAGEASRATENGLRYGRQRPRMFVPR